LLYTSLANLDPVFLVVIRIQGFDDPKLKKYIVEKKSISYRRSLLQPSKENIQHFKKEIYYFFLFFMSFLPSWVRIQGPH
jgi:hypothetical protein